MMILAIDTCCGRCSVAIFKDDTCIQYLIEETPNRQAELAIPMIEEALKNSQLQYRDLGYFTCTVGPGSFTGIRIGIAAIQGINQTLRKNVLGISTMECMSYFSCEKEVMTCLDAGRSQYYCQTFNNNIPTSKILLLDKDVALKLAGNVKIIGALGNKELPDAKLLATAALRRIKDNALDKTALKPLYIRESDAVEKKKLESKA